MYTTVFISHSKYDEEVAKEIEDVIRESGFIAWRFQRDMQGGRSWPPQLPQSIELHEIFLYLATPFAQLSDTCQKELQHAALSPKPLVTVTTHPTWLPPSPLNDHQAVFYDGTAKAGVRLLLALQGAQALNQDKIPENWSRWDGTSKLEVENAKKKESDTPLTQISLDFTIVERRNFLHSAISQIQATFEDALQQLEASDSRIATRFGLNSSSGFTNLIWMDEELLKGCRVYISADFNGITFDGSTLHALQWEVEEIRRQMRDTNGQIESNLQAVIDGDANAAALVRSLDSKYAALREELQQIKRIPSILQHEPGGHESDEFYTLRSIVGKRNGDPVLDFLPSPILPTTMNDTRICTFEEAAKMLTRIFIGDV